MHEPDILNVLTVVADAFEEIGIAYYIGGSVASSYYGEGRSTADVDFIAQIRQEDALNVIAHLEPTCYISREAVHDAIREHSTFNVIDYGTALKADVFVPAESEYERTAASRARPAILDNRVGARSFPLASPEDVVLNKLNWYRLTRRRSEKQWRDVIGVLTIQKNELDYGYLREWAQLLNLVEDLAKALTETTNPRPVDLGE